MGAVFQLCHFKSKKTQTAPNCLLPRELSTPQKPSSGQQWRTICTLCLLSFTCSLAVSQSEPVLTSQEAARKIFEYAPAQEVVEAHFPNSLSTSPILINSAGPAPVSAPCLASWRNAFEELTNLSYLSGFHEVDDGLGITTSQLTERGREFFRPLMPGSIFWVVTAATGEPAGDLEVIQITGEKRRRVSVEFRTKTTDPFAVMWRNRLFNSECRGELDDAEIFDDQGLIGHAHFRFRGSGWKVQQVMPGRHRGDE